MVIAQLCNFAGDCTFTDVVFATNSRLFLLICPVEPGVMVEVCDNSLNVDTVVKEFIAGQDKLLQLLDRAKGKDLAKIHIPITLTKLIKLRLGDTFRFLIAHEQRHMIQARNMWKEIGVSTDKFPVILQ